jgi:hypothetical protein
MPRYYFHVQRAQWTALDEEGTCLPNLQAAREEAVASARELLANAIKAGKNQVPDVILIADEDGRKLLLVSTKEAIPPQLR